MHTIRSRHGATALAAIVSLGLFASACAKSAPTNPFDRVDGSTIRVDSGSPLDAGIDATNDSSIFNPFVDSGTLDAGGMTPDGGTSVSPMGLNDLIPCNTSVDCPAVLGGAIDCIKSVPLSHADALGATSVAITDIFPGLNVGGVPYTGVCTTTCTFSEETCENVVLTGAGGVQVPFTCRLITQGASPYPEPAPGYPFVVDTASMIRGLAFGALCVPPTEIDPATNPGICGSCDTTTGCTSGQCWDFLTDEPVAGATTGTCLPTCDASTPCPLGYTCDALDDAGGAPLGTFCRPITDTCTSCRDVDSDGRGVGRCTQVGLGISQIDCDEYNTAAYYDSTDMLHPFATGYCGDTDFNCNGQNDQVEIVARPDLYGAMHCAGCGSACAGRVPAGAENGTKTCVATTGGMSEPTGVCVSLCDDPVNEADCDADPDTGCEYTASTGATFYYGDTDGDGAGSPQKQQVSCSGAVPASCGGAQSCVSNSADCNDSNAQVFGAYGGPATPLDICNGTLDDDCDGSLNEDAIGASCAVAGALPNCVAGTVSACSGAGVATCTTSYPVHAEVCLDASMIDEDCDGTLNNGFNPGGIELTCDGIDDNCDGAIDDHVIGAGHAGGGGLAATGTRVLFGAPCNVADDDIANNDAQQGSCRTGIWSCAGATWRCAPALPAGEARGFDGVDSNCDGFDLNTNEIPASGAYAIYVKGGVTGTMGTFAAPHSSLVTALAQAAQFKATPPANWSGSRPIDIYIASTANVSDSAKSTLVAGVNLYGGLDNQFQVPGTLGTGGAYSCGTNSKIYRTTPLATLRTMPVGVDRYNNVAMEALNINAGSPILLRCLEVHAEITAATMVPAGEPGYSNYGFRCVNCAGVTFDQVAIYAGAGIQGGAGIAGTASSTSGAAGVNPGSSSTAGTLPVTSDFCDNTSTANNNGGAGGAGMGGAAESRDGSTYCITTDFPNSPSPTAGSGSGGTAGGAVGGGTYTLGGNGGSGGAGAAGASFSAMGSVSGDYWVISSAPGSANGTAGGHGSGGGGASGRWAGCSTAGVPAGNSGIDGDFCCYWPLSGGGCPQTSAGASGAGGGCLGNGGGAGYTGGNSIALYIGNAGAGSPMPTVTTVANVPTLQLNRSAAGGGGTGGAGGNGSNGGDNAGSAYGGAGGGGGGGGGGTGGPGGDSYCLAYANTGAGNLLSGIPCLPNGFVSIAGGGMGGLGGMGGTGGRRGDNVYASSGAGGPAGPTGPAGHTCTSNIGSPSCP